MAATKLPTDEEIVTRGQELYERQLRAKLDNEQNLGKILVIDVESGEYELDSDEIAASRRAAKRFAGHPQYMLRVGYDAVHTFGPSLTSSKR